MVDQSNPDGWTFATLYKHITMLSDASKEAVTAAMASAEKAVLKADQANEKRFDSVNEFRAAMKDQQGTFADKEQTERRLRVLEASQANQIGKDRGIGMIGSIIIGSAVVFSGIIAALGFIYSISRHG
jgi:hypothetical protein